MTAGQPESGDDIAALAKGGRTNIAGFLLRLLARIPFLFIAGRVYGPDIVGRFAVAVLAVEFAALIATLGLKRGLAQALTETDRPHAHVAWDALLVAGIASLIAFGVLAAVPELMFPNSGINGLDRLLPLAVFALAWSDIALAALAYRRNVKAAVTARAVIEPWTISIAAFVMSFYSLRDGLILSYAVSTIAALTASIVPFVRSYGMPGGWEPRIVPLFNLARANAPLAGADAIEWASRNVDRFILSVAFPPAVVGVYFMAQQVSSIPQKLKTSFDPILGPVITTSLATRDYTAIARQVCQVGFWVIAAQTGLALMGSIPSEGVMGVVGPQFVAGSIALVFLLFAEVAASTGAVCESALVYMARKRNLAISAIVLTLQITLSFMFIAVFRDTGLSLAWQTAAPAVGLLIAVGIGSLAKAYLLGRLTKSSVSPFRRSLFIAAAVAAAIGSLATHLVEWAELTLGEPLMAISYLATLWRFSEPGDRQLLTRRKVSAGSAASP